MNCPHCHMPTKAHDDQSYMGEMRVCPKCGFQAYLDEWNNKGKHEPSVDLWDTHG